MAGLGNAAPAALAAFAPGADSRVYAHRLHAFVGERCYRVGSQALSWSDADGGQGQLEFGDVRKLQLRYSPGRLVERRYTLDLIARRGKRLRINNLHYRGFADFEDRSDSYRPFVLNLHRALALANPALQCAGGSTWAGHLLHLGIALGLLLLLAVAGLALLSAGLAWLIVVKLALIVFYMPRLWRFLKRNRPGRYDPLTPPEHLLP